MKKTLVALAVLTAAGSANAGIDLYNDNGVNVTLSGAAEVQYLQTIQKSDGPSDDAGFHLDDGDLQLNTTVAVTDKLNAVAGIGFAFESRDVTNDELWVGFSGDFGQLTFGRQLYITDDAGIGKDYELGLEQVDLVQTEGNEAIKYVFDNGTFYFGATHDLDSAQADGTSGSDDFLGADGTVTDARLGARFADFDVRGYYYTAEDLSGGIDVDGFNLEAEYVMNAFAFAASYGQVEYTSSANSAIKSDVDVFEINGSYTLDKNTFALGYNRADATAENGGANGKETDTIDNIYANVTHQLHSNVKVYAELGYADGDKADYDMGYLAGMEVKF
jgi:predicted porin